MSEVKTTLKTQCVCRWCEKDFVLPVQPCKYDGWLCLGCQDDAAKDVVKMHWMTKTCGRWVDSSELRLFILHSYNARRPKVFMN